MALRLERLTQALGLVASGRRRASPAPGRQGGGVVGPLSLVMLATLSAACGRSPAAKAEEARAKLDSWEATLELLAQQRARGAVPERFAEQVIRAADEERRKAQAQLRGAQAP
jgi:hypothetical protein